MSPPLRRDQLTRDREAEPGAATVAVAGLVEPCEAVEDPFPVAHGDAGAVVGHRDDSPVRRTAEGQVDAGRSVSAGVLDQVAHDLLELEPAQRQVHRRRPRRRPPPPPPSGRRTSPTPPRAWPAGPAGRGARPRPAWPARAGPRPARKAAGRRRPRSSSSARLAPWRRATSTCMRSEARGLRSSWATFAPKLRSRSRAAPSRASMELRVTASAWISSRDSGSGSRSSWPAPETRSAAARSDSTGRSAARSPARRSGRAPAAATDR